MKVNWPGFKKDPYFFLKYFFGQMMTSVGIFGCLWLLRDTPQMSFEVGTLPLLILPVSILIGIQLPAMMHNAVHQNIRPRWLNEVIGEAAGFFVLFGLGPFRISHFMHHAFADSELDPHPPEGKGFLHFLATTQLNTIRVIRGKFLDFHGNTAKNHVILFAEMSFYYASLVARIFTWYWLLGPTWFTFFYLPAYITNVLVFAHINFATHATQPDGKVVIINLNHNAYYRFVNFIGSGVYFHKNHHAKPFLYNPTRISPL